MKTEPVEETDQPNGHLQRDASTPPTSSSNPLPSPSSQPQLLTQTSSSTPSPPPPASSQPSTTPSNQLSHGEVDSHISIQRESDQSNDVNQKDGTKEQISLERNKLDKLFNCLRKVGSVIQELVEEGSESSQNFTTTSTYNPPPYRSKEEVPPSNHMPHSKVRKDFGCQKSGSISFVHRSVGDRNPLIRSMEEYETLETSDQRRYLISQLDAYSRQFFKIIEEKERRRRKLCHLQSEFISLMLPQFSIIHSIMAEGLRNEWQNKLKIIDELTRTLSDCEERLSFSNESYLIRDQSSSGINLSLSSSSSSSSHLQQQQQHQHQRTQRITALNNGGDLENEDEYENDEDDTETPDYEDLSRFHHNHTFNGNLSSTDPSHHEIVPGEEVNINSSAECLRLATERFAQMTKRNVEDSTSSHIEEGSGVPVDLTTDSDMVNQFARYCDASVSKRQYSRKPPVSLPPSTKYVNNVISNNGCTDPASPKPAGLHKYKICLFRDGGYRCYYIGKDRSCNMRQHWLHRHGVDNPPEHFYARKDLSDTEVQKYKLKYEVQKSNFPKNRDPLMSTIFHQQSPAKRAKLSPIQQENTPQA